MNVSKNIVQTIIHLITDVYTITGTYYMCVNIMTCAGALVVTAIRLQSLLIALTQHSNIYIVHTDYGIV